LDEAQRPRLGIPGQEQGRIALAQALGEECANLLFRRRHFVEVEVGGKQRNQVGEIGEGCGMDGHGEAPGAIPEYRQGARSAVKHPATPRRSWARDKSCTVFRFIWNKVQFFCEH
jgi:hypothetical protein